jgi:tRNA(Ile2) C34 agmatinyltransferase TiaS
MEIRKALGNRAVPGFYVPRYQRGPDYLIAHACFNCRKSWKLPEESTANCPQCGNSMSWMGRAFKAPKKTDTEQWRKVERLWSAGFRFHPNTGWRDVEPYPDRLRDVEGFIRQNLKHPFRVSV